MRDAVAGITIGLAIILVLLSVGGLITLMWDTPKPVIVKPAEAKPVLRPAVVEPFKPEPTRHWWLYLFLLGQTVDIPGHFDTQDECEKEGEADVARFRNVHLTGGGFYECYQGGKSDSDETHSTIMLQ